MFIQLNDESLINLYWLDDIVIDEYDDTKVNYIYVNGTKKSEQFNDASSASSRRTQVIAKILIK